jgi:hypothetical protein
MVHRFLWTRRAGRAAWRPVVGVALLVAAPLLAAIPASAAVGGTFDVTAYGAKGDGTTNSTAAVTAAIAAAEAAGGGTVYFPAGTYMLGGTAAGGSITLRGSVPVTLEGAGADSTTLVELVKGRTLISANVDGTVVEGLTLDSTRNNGGPALAVRANRTTLQAAQINGGTTSFALYYAGPLGATPDAPTYNTGNQVLNTAVTDHISNDGFSFSFQQNALIQNVTHTGSRLALYVDDGVQVHNYTYQPGTGPVGSGFWITAPSHNMLIDGFTTSGNGGVVEGAGSRTSTNITINNEQFLGTGAFNLQVGNVDGMTISNSGFNAANLRFIGPVSNMTVSTSSVAQTVFGQPLGQPATVTFQNDQFTSALAKPRHATFLDVSGAAATVAVTGGTWLNHGGIFAYGAGATYTVSGLQGCTYNPLKQTCS